jgi:hypothetical protein
MRFAGPCLLAFWSCGKVERKTEEVAPCDAYCDTVIDTCGVPLERVDCAFQCDCMQDVAQPEIADDFIECLAELPCDATEPQQICALTVGARLEGEPSETVLQLISDCEGRVAALGGCPDLELPCETAVFVIDEAVPALRECLAEPDCDALDECVGSAFFVGCMGG